jgi:transcriptional regulator with XRE-family HTH domain
MNFRKKTNDIFKEALENSKISHTKFAKLVRMSQPNISEYVKDKFELRLSLFERFMKELGLEYDLVLVKDKHQYSTISDLRNLEIKLIKQFSKETDYEIKKVLDKKIEAIKVLLDT